MPFENSSEQFKPSEVHQPSTAALLPSNHEMQSFYKSGTSAASEPSFLDFGTSANLYGHDNLIAQALPQQQPGIPEGVHKQLDANAQQLQTQGRIDESGNWQFQNPRVRHGQDLAGAIKEALWNTFNPSPGKVAENNLEFLYQFLTGTGKDIQEHTDKNDPVLKDFMQSPGAEAIRKQFQDKGCPAFTDKLGYGTFEAALDTVVPHRANPFDNAAFASNLPGDYLPNDMIYPNWGSVAAQVGGFGNPPKDTPWAKASATRMDADGKPNPQGSFVQFQVINVAGAHSFNLHIPRIHDRAIGSTGPERSIIQTFQWTEPIKPQQ